MGGNIGGVLRNSVDLTVVTTNTYYTKSFSVKNANVVGIWYKATSTVGAPDIKIEVEQSYTKPTTEEAADTNWVEPELMSDIETNLTTETAHIKSISLTPMPYARLKITGNAANPADTVFNARIFVQEGL